jgi:hypothetical protein
VGREGTVFVNSTELNEFFETSEGVMWVTSRIQIIAADLLPIDLLAYPATSAREEMGVGAMVQIFHAIMDQARAEEFSTCTALGERRYKNKPARMISITRRLR